MNCDVLMDHTACRLIVTKHYLLGGGKKIVCLCVFDGQLPGGGASSGQYLLPTAATPAAAGIHAQAATACYNPAAAATGFLAAGLTEVSAPASSNIASHANNSAVSDALRWLFSLKVFKNVTSQIKSSCLKMHAFSRQLRVRNADIPSKLSANVFKQNTEKYFLVAESL